MPAATRPTDPPRRPRPTGSSAGRPPPSRSARLAAAPTPAADGRGAANGSGSARARRAGRGRGRGQGAGAGRRPAARRRPVRARVPVLAGVAWAAVVLVAVTASSFLTAVVLAPVAAVASASTLRATEPARRRRGRSSRRPPLLLVVALGSAVLDPLIALAGPYEAGAVLVVSAVAVSVLVVRSTYARSARPLPAVVGRLTAALAPAVAATCVVVARHQGASLALALVTAVLLYDAAAFVMGHGRTPLGGAVGVVSGVLSVAVVAVFVAAVVNPPFSGSRPLVVFALTAAAAPAGVRLGQMAAGSERLPALRRLDSLFLAGPLWVLAAALLLHR